MDFFLPIRKPTNNHLAEVAKSVYGPRIIWAAAQEGIGPNFLSLPVRQSQRRAAVIRPRAPQFRLPVNPAGCCPPAAALAPVHDWPSEARPACRWPLGGCPPAHPRPTWLPGPCPQPHRHRGSGMPTSVVASWATGTGQGNAERLLVVAFSSCSPVTRIRASSTGTGRIAGMSLPQADTHKEASK